MNSEAYVKRQDTIAKSLNLKKNNKSIDLLLSNLSDKDQFIVFNHR